MVDLSDYAAGRAGLAGLRMAPANPYSFTGRRLDFDIRDDGAGQTGRPGRPLLALYDYRAREYDPWHGRFTSRDPAEYAESLNLYQYVLSNPLAFTDSSGRQLVHVLVAPLGASQARAQDAYRVGVAEALILSMLSACIIYNELGQMQWGVGGGISASDFALFVEGVEATIGGSYAVGEACMALATIAVFSMSQAEAVQKVQQLGPTLFAHIASVMTGGPDDPDRNHHLDEIKGYLEKIGRFVNRMAGGKVQKAFEKWLESALKWLENPGNNPPPGPLPG